MKLAYRYSKVTDVVNYVSAQAIVSAPSDSASIQLKEQQRVAKFSAVTWPANNAGGNCISDKAHLAHHFDANPLCFFR